MKIATKLINVFFGFVRLKRGSLAPAGIAAIFNLVPCPGPLPPPSHRALADDADLDVLPFHVQHDFACGVYIG
jgi:hypothetical protein